MKRMMAFMLLAFLLCATAFAFAETTEQRILGTWESPTTEAGKIVLTFEADGSCYGVMSFVSISGTYTVSGNEITLTVYSDQLGETDTATLTLSAVGLIMNGDTSFALRRTELSDGTLGETNGGEWAPEGLWACDDESEPKFVFENDGSVIVILKNRWQQTRYSQENGVIALSAMGMRYTLAQQGDRLVQTGINTIYSHVPGSRSDGTYPSYEQADHFWSGREAGNGYLLTKEGKFYTVQDLFGKPVFTEAEYVMAGGYVLIHQGEEYFVLGWIDQGVLNLYGEGNRYFAPGMSSDDFYWNYRDVMPTPVPTPIPVPTPTPIPTTEPTLAPEQMEDGYEELFYSMLDKMAIDPQPTELDGFWIGKYAYGFFYSWIVYEIHGDQGFKTDDVSQYAGRRAVTYRLLDDGLWVGGKVITMEEYSQDDYQHYTKYQLDDDHMLVGSEVLLVEDNDGVLALRHENETNFEGYGYLQKIDMESADTTIAVELEKRRQRDEIIAQQQARMIILDVPDADLSFTVDKTMRVNDYTRMCIWTSTGEMDEEAICYSDGEEFLLTYRRDLKCFLGHCTFSEPGTHHLRVEVRDHVLECDVEVTAE